ncbi:hypothetical protein LPB140_00650 [Sphingorhabdus lutea]|uniref:YgjP-like metallopeptidase domain-containing protein n=2 Tax=Sphingorhabdus lutea TaxID=1913578 RepID=A0A1L3JE82_9SPHN|nr:hypothetical protein LPB140_00650 [Sphingorhabdus lutea]
MLDRLSAIFSKNHYDPQFTIDGHDYPILITRNARARNISLRADPVRREIRITMPNYAQTSQALEFVEKKREWLSAKLSLAAKHIPFDHRAIIGICGEEVEIIWDETASRHVTLKEQKLYVGGPRDHISPRITRWIKAQARKIFAKDLAHYCQKLGVATPRLSIGDPRSRWGSCSSNGTIRISWRLYFAPRFVQRAVIAHEVAHLRHMDHSKAFYALLDILYEGNRKQADKWLKMHGTGLHMVGRE